MRLLSVTFLMRTKKTLEFWAWFSTGFGKSALIRQPEIQSQFGMIVRSIKQIPKIMLALLVFIAACITLILVLALYQKKEIKRRITDKTRSKKTLGRGEYFSRRILNCSWIETPTIFDTPVASIEQLKNELWIALELKLRRSLTHLLGK